MLPIMNNHEEPLRLDQVQLRKLQLEMLELLVEFDRICRKYHIRYFLSCGTLLGAVRHKGFIPWDDDIDVEMLRSDYAYFCSVCEHEMDHERFFFQDHRHDVNYLWFYGKVRRKKTSFIRVGQRHLRQQNGICMDVFVLDEVCESAVGQRVHEVTCRGFRKILWSSIGQFEASSSYGRMLYRLLAKVSHRKVLSLFEKFARRYENGQHSLLAFNNTEVRTKRGYAFKKSWYAETVEMEFEKHKFMAPCGYHEILYLKYGDYMQYPPLAKRIGTAGATYIKFSDGAEIGCVERGG